MKLIFKILLHIFIIIAIVAVIGYLYYAQDLPDIADFDKDGRRKTVSVDFANGRPITSFGDIYHDKVKFYELPTHLINAVIATEDQKFFSHHGVDFSAILRAFYANQRAGRVVQGGSTITQQLAKLLFLSPDRNMKRKIQEVILALKLEQKYAKEQIFTMYLNHAYFGSGNYGISSAAKYYFKKNVADINLNESALLAGLLKAPSKLSPKNDKDLAQERANVVLGRMMKSGFLDKKSLKELNNQASYTTDRLQRLYFADYVFDQFDEFLNKKDLNNESIIVKTTLNEIIQSKLEDEINKFTDINDKKLKKAQIAVVIMDKTGAILGMTGGRDYQKSQFNRAISSKRPAGSAFKTFIYLTAFENGFAPGDVFEDKEISIGDWNPKNYDGKYYGEITLKEAFARSLNSVAIQLTQKLSRKKVAKMAKKLGILGKIKEDDLTIALGTTNVSLLELASSYATIANEGKPVIPHSIEEIFSGNNVLYKRETSGFDAVISPQTLNYTNYILRSVVENGTGKNANVAMDIFGKTGTSQDYKDAWFIGFNSKYIVGVWIGNDDNSAMDKITGGSYPATLFAKIISRI